MAIDTTNSTSIDIRDIAYDALTEFTRYSLLEITTAYGILVRENYREQPIEDPSFMDLSIIDSHGDALVVALEDYASLPLGLKQASWAVQALINYITESRPVALNSPLLRLLLSCALSVGNLQFQFLDYVLAEEEATVLDGPIATTTAYPRDPKNYVDAPPAKYANEVWNLMTDAQFNGITGDV